MKVLVIGATGAVGLPLVSQLVERGHTVVGTSRTRERAETLREFGAEPAVLDVLDREAVRRMVQEIRPDAITHQATALAGRFDFKRFAETFAQTNRLRTEGTANLLSAAKDAGVERFVAQSYGGGITYARVGGPVKTEDDPLDDSLPEAVHETVAAIKYLEAAVLDAGGIALRYSSFYGAAIDPMRDAVRERKVPIVGDGGGVWSLVHVVDAAAVTALALERGESGVYNVADDEPAPAREVIPALAEALGAPPPRKVPAWLARLFAGELGVIMMTEVRGSLEREGEAGARLDAPVSELAAGVPGDVRGSSGGLTAHAACGPSATVTRDPDLWRLLVCGTLDVPDEEAGLAA